VCVCVSIGKKPEFTLRRLCVGGGARERRGIITFR